MKSHTFRSQDNVSSGLDICIMKHSVVRKHTH